MTTQYYARTGNIAEAARLTQKCEADVRDIVQALLRRTNTTLAGWEGPAATAYRGTTAKWNAQATQILDALHGMSLALSHSQDNYDRTETAHSTNLQQFTYSI